MPQFITFLTQNGIPEEAAIWLLMIPVAITVVVISRQIIGIKGFGISTPILIGFAYAATGIQAGTIIFLTILVAGFIMRAILKNVRLLYLPKMALLMSGVAAAVFLLTPVLPYRDSMEFPQAIFSLIILILFAEQFASFLIERGARKTFNIVIETFIVSIAIFFVITSEWLQVVVSSYPLFILLGVVAVNFILGKWTGLRFSEYIRFKDLISK